MQRGVWSQTDRVVSFDTNRLVKPNLLVALAYLSLLFGFVGCGGVSEEKPPEKAPEMSAEETENMNKQMEDMRNMRKQKK